MQIILPPVSNKKILCFLPWMVYNNHKSKKNVPGEECMDFYEKKLDSSVEYQGKILSVRRDTVELVNGRQAEREVVDHRGAVAIVPVDEKGRVLLVRQYRYPVLSMMTEIPAGKLDPGEDPLDCAKRELSEETGAEAEEMIFMGAMYPTPGFCNELLHFYLARGLKFGQTHPDEDEFVEVQWLPLEEVYGMIMNNEIRDMKTVAGVLKARQLLIGGKSED